jgi:hypothetical protein
MAVQDIFTCPSCFAVYHEGCISFTEWGHGTGDEVWDLKFHSKVTDEQILK